MPPPDAKHRPVWEPDDAPNITGGDEFPRYQTGPVVTAQDDLPEPASDLERAARRRRAIARRQARDGITTTGRTAPTWLDESPWVDERDPAS